MERNERNYVKDEQERAFQEAELADQVYLGGVESSSSVRGCSKLISLVQEAELAYSVS